MVEAGGKQTVSGSRQRSGRAANKHSPVNRQGSRQAAENHKRINSPIGNSITIHRKRLEMITGANQDFAKGVCVCVCVLNSPGNDLQVCVAIGDWCM